MGKWIHAIIEAGVGRKLDLLHEAFKTFLRAFHQEGLMNDFKAFLLPPRSPRQQNKTKQKNYCLMQLIAANLSRELVSLSCVNDSERSGFVLPCYLQFLVRWAAWKHRPWLRAWCFPWRKVASLAVPLTCHRTQPCCSCLSLPACFPSPSVGFNLTCSISSFSVLSVLQMLPSLLKMRLK
jgi:hypothetical protein